MYGGAQTVPSARCLGPVFRVWSLRRVHQTHTTYKPMSRLRERISAGRVWNPHLEETHVHNVWKAGGPLGLPLPSLDLPRSDRRGLAPLRAVFKRLPQRGASCCQSSPPAPAALRPSLHVTRGPVTLRLACLLADSPPKLIFSFRNTAISLLHL